MIVDNCIGILVNCDQQQANGIQYPNKDVVSLVPVQKKTAHGLYTITVEVIKNVVPQVIYICGHYIHGSIVEITDTWLSNDDKNNTFGQWLHLTSSPQKYW